MASDFIYYIYAYIDQTGSPYYIGKGKHSRAYQQHGEHISVPNKSNIIIMESDLSEIGALALERRYIKWYGRKDNKTGILHNRTNGGEGHSMTLFDRLECHIISVIKDYDYTLPDYYRLLPVPVGDIERRIFQRKIIKQELKRWETFTTTKDRIKKSLANKLKGMTPAERRIAIRREERKEWWKQRNKELKVIKDIT